MTAYGESVTQKEISTVSYIVMQGALPENAESGQPSSFTDAYKWEKVQPDRYELRFQEFYFQHADLTGHPAAKNKLSATSDVILMQFCLQGHCGYADENGKDLISLKPAEYNVLCIPPKRALEFMFEAGKSETVAVFLEKGFLLKYIPANHILFRKVQANALETLHPANLTINLALQSVLHEIANCVFNGHLKKLYTQAKIIELLALHIAQLEEEKTDTNCLKQAEIDKMQVVKHIIDKHFNEPLSLGNLAREVVTNEQYLKKHFKIVFGCTVFNYILRCRMEKAKELLLTGDFKIAEVAEQTGYKHATHFTNAFKKFFGYLPQKIKGKVD